MAQIDTQRNIVQGTLLFPLPQRKNLVWGDTIFPLLQRENLVRGALFFPLLQRDGEKGTLHVHFPLTTKGEFSVGEHYFFFYYNYKRRILCVCVCGGGVSLLGFLIWPLATN